MWGGGLGYNYTLIAIIACVTMSTKSKYLRIHLIGDHSSVGSKHQAKTPSSNGGHFRSPPGLLLLRGASQQIPCGYYSVRHQCNVLLYDYIQTTMITTCQSFRLKQFHQDCVLRCGVVRVRHNHPPFLIASLLTESAQPREEGIQEADRIHHLIDGRSHQALR